METIATHLLEEAFIYLENRLELRLTHFLNIKRKSKYKVDFPPRQWNGTPHPLAQFCARHQLNEAEFLVLLLALVQHVDPYLLDNVIQKYLTEGGNLPQVGGVRGQNQRSFLPTGETALFLIAGNNIENRIKVQALFNSEHIFHKKQILSLGDVQEGEPKLSGKIILSEECIDLFTIGKISPPKYSSQFPAKKIDTQMCRKDLIVNSKTSEKLLEIERWLKHHEWLNEETFLGKRLKPGYRALFWGPPGTGKTLTASLLGNHYQKDVYRIDLSQIISKYIGETEKNLSRLFDKAENKDWILFFDEADALFGKRVNVKEAKDKYANQETSYLLQKIEDYPGLVILASNLKDNIDKAFFRRFHSIIHFPFPTAKERLQLWQTTLPSVDHPQLPLSPKIKLQEISRKYKVTGASINNIVQYCCYMALEQGAKQLELDVLLDGIRNEFEKEMV